MWDNARFLNAVADVLYLVAAALALLGSSAQAAVRVPFAPVRDGERRRQPDTRRRGGGAAPRSTGASRATSSA